MSKNNLSSIALAQEEPANRHPELRKPEAVPRSSLIAYGGATLAHTANSVNNKKFCVYYPKG
jgi:hypothetical protein